MTVCAYCGRPILKKAGNYVSLTFWDENNIKREVGWCCHKGNALKDGFLTRQSDRMVKQQREYAADFVQPQIYDKTKRKLVINEQFVKLYPDKVGTYFSPGEIKKAGLSKLADFAVKQETVSKRIKQRQKDIQFAGSEHRGIKRILGK